MAEQRTLTSLGMGKSGWGWIGKFATQEHPFNNVKVNRE